MGLFALSLRHNNRPHHPSSARHNALSTGFTASRPTTSSGHAASRSFGAPHFRGQQSKMRVEGGVQLA